MLVITLTWTWLEGLLTDADLKIPKSAFKYNKSKC